MKVLYNAVIHTLHGSQPLASALVIDHGAVIGIGGSELLSEFHGGERQDLQGRVVLPGLTDAHLHLKHYALSLQKIDCEADALEACLHRVAEKALHAAAGEWIQGHGWNHNVWGGWPRAADLDQIAPQQPVFLTAKSLHAAWANSAALRLAHINPETPDPKDGQIQRDASGEPTGILLEGAAMLVSCLIPEPGVYELAAALDKAQSILWKMGLTGAHDFDGPDCFMALQALHAGGRLKLRVTKSIPVELLEHACELGLSTGFGDDWLRIGSVKAFMDGALGPRTAAMLQSYAGDPDNRGVLKLDAEQLFELGCRAARSGLGMAVHAIGDRANHEALDAFEHLRAYESQNGLPHLRHRIEHVQLLHAADAARLASLNVTASMQPIHATSDMLMAERYWEERNSLAYAPRTQLDLGARVAFGSDAPVESPNPFWGIHAAVTRRRADGSPSPDGWYPEQRLGIRQAIEGFSTGPAYAVGAENRLGSLAAGNLADLIVLDRDPFACDPHELRHLQPSATMVGGEWVFQN